MARKERKQRPLDERQQEALENWKAVTEVRYDLAKEALDHQDEETKAVIWRIVNRLRVGASGFITIDGKPMRIEQEYLDYNLLYIATEILKDLAFFDIRVGTYKFPPTLCAQCGAEIDVKEAKPRRKR